MVLQMGVGDSLICSGQYPVESCVGKNRFFLWRGQVADKGIAGKTGLGFYI